MCTKDTYLRTDCSYWVKTSNQTHAKSELTDIEIHTWEIYKERIPNDWSIEVPTCSVCYFVGIEEESCRVASEADLENTRIVNYHEDK